MIKFVILMMAIYMLIVFKYHRPVSLRRNKMVAQKLHDDRSLSLFSTMLFLYFFLQSFSDQRFIRTELEEKQMYQLRSFINSEIEIRLLNHHTLKDSDDLRSR